MRRSALGFLLIASSLWATVPWDREDFREREKRSRPAPSFELPQGEENWQRWSYPHQFMRTAEFLASMQVVDPEDPEYGGIIEGEDALNIVETDNTQEAIWVFSRYKEITGQGDYDIPLERAWIYVENHPAYSEEGMDSDYYRVWNSGLALMAEGKYREVTGDSSFLSYADSCASYIIDHPLPFSGVSSFYKRLHPKVTAQAAGMLYQYAKKRGRPDWMEVAVSMGESVIVWIEQDPESHINDEIWAMSGGTCIWGISNSVFQEDSLLGASWLETYLPLMKTFQPGGDWSNSWNIWYAWGYEASFAMTGDSSDLQIHHAIVDSLLSQDLDNDGGVPPSYGGEPTGDHSWVSSYMLFMGINELWDRLREKDAGIPGVLFPPTDRVIRSGDTLDLSFLVANYGLSDLIDFPVYVDYLGVDTIISIDFSRVDSLTFEDVFTIQDTGYATISIFTDLPGDERALNDLWQGEYLVYPSRQVDGVVIDSVTEKGISAWVYFTLKGDTVPFDSSMTNAEDGSFTIRLIDSTFYVRVEPELPYPEVHDTIMVSPEDIPYLEVRISPARILLVNKDPDGNYGGYVSNCLDSLGISYVYWPTVISGPVPFHALPGLRDNLLLWMTGDGEVNTISETEQESLQIFLGEGGKLFLTGQNIAEDLQGSEFLHEVLGVEFVSSPITSAYCYPLSEDSLGSILEPFITVNGGSALNQTSRDQIAPRPGSHSFLSYDTTGTQVAGIWKGDSFIQVVFLGIGLEGIGWTPAYPDFMNRKQVMLSILGAMGMTGVQEAWLTKKYRKPEIVVLRNPSRGVLLFSLSSVDQIPAIRIFNIEGRNVLTLDLRYTPGKEEIFKVEWNLPSGLYFLKAQGYPGLKPVPFLMIR